MTEAQVYLSDGLIVAYGSFPSGSSDPSIEIREVLASEEPKLRESGAKHMGPDGTITVTPPPPEPLITARGFAVQEDQERLALVAERSQADPAFAALAELALGKQP